MYAANKSRKTVVELLLQRGADVYVTDKVSGVLKCWG